MKRSARSSPAVEAHDGGAATVGLPEILQYKQRRTHVYTAKD